MATRSLIETPRPPDFENLLAILRREKPARPTIFEFIMEPSVVLGEERIAERRQGLHQTMRMYLGSGYDFVPLSSGQLQFLTFPRKPEAGPKQESRSQFGASWIGDWESFEAYPWPDPDAPDYGIIEELARELPGGARFLCMSPGGIFENMVELIGLEHLCYLLADEPELVRAVADSIASRLLRYYERFFEFPSIGAVMVNDDWGFKTQTVLAPEQMRTLVFPWYRRIVALAHQAGRPVMLHSCGQMAQVWEDIIEDMKFDGKHSYEDAILPVEDAYESLGDRIAILGGIDIDFLVRRTPEEIESRARGLLERSADRGSYALGSGNSITRYVPRTSFQAMTRAALD